jgi:hypothetical protein
VLLVHTHLVGLNRRTMLVKLAGLKRLSDIFTSCVELSGCKKRPGCGRCGVYGCGCKHACEQQRHAKATLWRILLLQLIEHSKTSASMCEVCALAINVQSEQHPRVFVHCTHCIALGGLCGCGRFAKAVERYPRARHARVGTCTVGTLTRCVATAPQPDSENTGASLTTTTTNLHDGCQSAFLWSICVGQGLEGRACLARRRVAPKESVAGGSRAHKHHKEC